MSDHLAPERLTEIRTAIASASDDTGLTYSIAADEWLVTCDKPTARFLTWAHRDATALLAEVDRLRAGIEALRKEYRHPDCFDALRRVAAPDLAALLSPEDPS